MSETLPLTLSVSTSLIQVPFRDRFFVFSLLPCEKKRGDDKFKGIYPGHTNNRRCGEVEITPDARRRKVTVRRQLNMMYRPRRVLNFKFTEKLRGEESYAGEKSITAGVKTTSSQRAEENVLFGKWAITRESRKVYIGFELH